MIQTTRQQSWQGIEIPPCLIVTRCTARQLEATSQASDPIECHLMASRTDRRMNLDCGSTSKPWWPRGTFRPIDLGGPAEIAMQAVTQQVGAFVWRQVDESDRIVGLQCRRFSHGDGLRVLRAVLECL